METTTLSRPKSTSKALSRRAALAILATWLGAVGVGSTWLYAKNDASKLSLTKAFVDLGIDHCMDRVDDIAQHIVSDGEHASMVYFAEADPEKQMLSLLVGRGGENDNYLATIDFSQNDSCSATYEITRLWSDNCSDVIKRAYPDYNLRGAMPGGFELFERNANLHIAVSSLADNGCLTVQKEMIF